MVSLNKILTKGKALYLAYDQGLEHGPVDFNDRNVDPLYILKIAKEGKYNAVIFQKGIAEKYHKEIKASKVPLIIKLNGKSSLYKGEPISRQLCTVKEARSYGAVAVGYTIYVGSQHETIMLQEFENILREAHALNMPAITWIYPRGKSIEGKDPNDLMVYAARIALEIGADMVKLHFAGDKKKLKWAVKSAERTKVVIAGGAKADEASLFEMVHTIMDSGATGLAIGRNIWQAEHPLELTKKIKKIIWK